MEEKKVTYNGKELLNDFGEPRARYEGDKIIFSWKAGESSSVIIDQLRNLAASGHMPGGVQSYTMQVVRMNKFGRMPEDGQFEFRG